MRQPREMAVRLPDDHRFQPPPHPIAMRYVTEIPPCPEAEPPKVSTHSPTPNARLATAHAARPTSQHLPSAIGGQSTGAPARSAGTTWSPGCSPCKPNTPPGTTSCRIASATLPPLRPCRPSSIWISMSSSPSCHREGTDAIDRPATSNVHQQLSRKIRRAALAPLDGHQGKMRRDNRQWQPPAATTCRSPATVQDHRNAQRKDHSARARNARYPPKYGDPSLDERRCHGGRRKAVRESDG